jgi:hypothetical protein
MLNDLLLPFFFFLLYISRKKLSALGPAKKKKAPTQQTPLFELLDGRRTRTPYGGRLYPTELPSHHQQQKRAVHPFLSRILFFVFSILLINSDDDDFVFLETLSQSIEIHFYAAPGGRTRQCQDSFLYRQQLHFTRYRTSYLLYNTQCSSSIVETLCGFSKALSDDDNPYSHEMLKNISAACVNERDFL